MTILSVVGGKGPGPIEGEEPERVSRSLHVSLLLYKCIHCLIQNIKIAESKLL